MRVDSARRVDRQVGRSILWRALRWRRSSSISLCVVAAFAVAAAAIGPMFLASADNSVLTTALAQAPPGTAAVTLIASGRLATFRQLVAAASHTSRLGNPRALGRPLVSAEGGVQFDSHDGTFAASLYSRTGLCGQLHFVAGSCPHHVGDVAISTRSATQTRARIGDSLSVRAPGVTSGPPVEVRVVGVYAPPAVTETSYWEGRNEFDFVPPKRRGALEQLDPLVTEQATVLAAIRLDVEPQFIADFNLLVGTIRAGEMNSLDDALHADQTTLDRTTSIALSTGLFALFASTRHDETQMDEVVAAIALQLVLLSLLVVYSLVSVSSRDRWLEAEIANRRGFTRWSLLRVAVGEPLAVLTVALPVGIALAWAGAAIAAHYLFVAGSSDTPDVLSVLAGIGGFVGGVVAAVVASWNLWHGTARATDRATRRDALVAAGDAVAVALGVVGLTALAVGGSLSGTHPDPVAAFAPALLALAGGVLAVRLAVVVIQALLHPTQDSRFVASFLALRELSRRRPSVLRRLLPLIAAIAVVVFSVAAWAVAADNRATVAAFDTGASTVDTVSTRPGVDLEQAVRAADPSGHQAMAVEILHSGSGGLLAVDPSRLAAVGAWPKTLSRTSVSHIARYLAPAERAPIDFSASALRVIVTLPHGSPAVELTATVFSPTSQDESTVKLGLLRPGDRMYTASLGGFCTSTCRLASLNAFASSRAAGHVSEITVTVTGLTAVGSDGQLHHLAVRAGRGPGWICDVHGVQVSKVGTTGVSFRVPSSVITGFVAFAPADVPRLIPAVATNEIAAGSPPAPGSPLTVTGLDDVPLNVSGDVSVADLPEVGSAATMVSLTLAELAQSGPLVDVTKQVWLSHSAGSSVLARLASDGVRVTASARASTRLAKIDRDPLALAYAFVVAAAPIAALLAIGAAAFAILASGRRRRAEFRGLLVIGIARSALARFVLIENAVVLGVSLLVGGIVGVLSAAIAVSSLPQSVGANSGFAPSTALPWAAVLLTLVAFGLLLAATAAAVSRAVIGGAFSEDPVVPS
jgi:putative ABC transport system permease protein